MRSAGNRPYQPKLPYHIFCYEPGVHEWLALHRSEFDRACPAVASFGGNLVVLGGKCGFDGQNAHELMTTSSVESYDIKTGVWSHLPSMSVARHWFAAVELDGRLYAIGGENETSEHEGGKRNFLDSVEVYTCQNHRWESLPPMSRLRSGHHVAVLGGKLYVVGGEEFRDGEDDESKLIVGEVYDPCQNVWSFFAPLEPSFSDSVAALLSIEDKLWAVNRRGVIRIYDASLDSWFDGPSPSFRVGVHGSAVLWQQCSILSDSA